MKETKIIKREGAFDIIGVFIDGVLTRTFRKRALNW